MAPRCVGSSSSSSSSSSAVGSGLGGGGAPSSSAGSSRSRGRPASASAASAASASPSSSSRRSGSSPVVGGKGKANAKTKAKTSTRTKATDPKSTSSKKVDQGRCGYYIDRVFSESELKNSRQEVLSRISDVHNWYVRFENSIDWHAVDGLCSTANEYHVSWEVAQAARYIKDVMHRVIEYRRQAEQEMKGLRGVSTDPNALFQDSRYKPVSIDDYESMAWLFRSQQLIYSYVNLSLSLESSKPEIFRRVSEDANIDPRFLKMQELMYDSFSRTFHLHFAIDGQETPVFTLQFTDPTDPVQTGFVIDYALWSKRGSKAALHWIWINEGTDEDRRISMPVMKTSAASPAKKKK